MMDKFNIKVDGVVYTISQMQVGKAPVFRAVIDGKAVFFEQTNHRCQPVPGSAGDLLLLNQIAKAIDAYIK